MTVLNDNGCLQRAEQRQTRGILTPHIPGQLSQKVYLLIILTQNDGTTEFDAWETALVSPASGPPAESRGCVTFALSARGDTRHSHAQQV